MVLLTFRGLASYSVRIHAVSMPSGSIAARRASRGFVPRVADQRCRLLQGVGKFWARVSRTVTRRPSNESVLHRRRRARQRRVARRAVRARWRHVGRVAANRARRHRVARRRTRLVTRIGIGHRHARRRRVGAGRRGRRASRAVGAGCVHAASAHAAAIRHAPVRIVRVGFIEHLLTSAAAAESVGQVPTNPQSPCRPFTRQARRPAVRRAQGPPSFAAMRARSPPCVVRGHHEPQLAGIVAHARRKRICVGGPACTPQRESRRLGRAERLFSERPHVGLALEHPVRAMPPAGLRSSSALPRRNRPSRQRNDEWPPRQPSCFVTRTILSASSRTSTGLHR